MTLLSILSGHFMTTYICDAVQLRMHESQAFPWMTPPLIVLLIVPVPRSSSVLRGHAEEPQHCLHRPLLHGVHPQNHRLWPIGQSHRPLLEISFSLYFHKIQICPISIYSQFLLFIIKFNNTMSNCVFNPSIVAQVEYICIGRCPELPKTHLSE